VRHKLFAFVLLLGYGLPAVFGHGLHALCEHDAPVAVASESACGHHGHTHACGSHSHGPVKREAVPVEGRFANLGGHHHHHDDSCAVCQFQRTAQIATQLVELPLAQLAFEAAECPTAIAPQEFVPAGFFARGPPSQVCGQV
jgi:hypothetical protein